jgi:hypothetical protein
LIDLVTNVSREHVSLSIDFFWLIRPCNYKVQLMELLGIALRVIKHHS